MKVNSVSGKNWEYKKFDYSEQKELSEKYSLSEIVSKLVAIRKNNINNIDFFLNPTIKDLLPNPYTIKDMQKAIKRSYEAICKKEKIAIFGDYDVDGASSTALLSRYFLLISQKVVTYIPDRKKEGYGPSIEGFNSLIASGADIIFTVDCGTLSFKPIIEAQKQKTDVIVLDHHQSEIKIPNACAVVNPNRHDDTSNLNYLCAAGVCFMFLVALNKQLRDSNWFKINNINEPNILNLLDLVSLATICDVVPLIDLNRAIVKQGLKIIKKRSNLGLKTLYDLCNIKSQPTTYDLGFKLGPRINAGGRVGKSSHGSELLTSDDPQEAYKIALDLDSSNSERQSIEKVLAEKVYMEVKNYHNHPVLVLSGTNWHEGIIGIVASRVKEKYNKPTILISLNGNIGKGSARSVYGFDIGAQIIKAVQLNILERGGGHKMAGGFSLAKKNIDNFRNFLIKNFEKKKIFYSQERFLYLDSKIAPSALNEEFYEDINSLAPFGSGNNEPKFVIEDLNVIKSDIVGDNHIKSILKGRDGSSIKSFAWNAVNGPLEGFLNVKNKKKITVAGKMSLNEYRGIRSIEFIIEDIAT